MRHRSILLAISSLLFCPGVTSIAAPAPQLFGDQQVISTWTNGPKAIYATDLDGDGDADVLAASELDDAIAWHENLGDGSFAFPKIIQYQADYARAVYAADLDGDGDADALSASWGDDTVAWYENLGAGSFGPQQVLSASLGGSGSVYASDLDQDGDLDVLAGGLQDSRVVWFENLGGGSFGPLQVIGTQSVAYCVRTEDLDLDGDEDIVVASLGDSISWYENRAPGVFGRQSVLAGSTWLQANTVVTADLDGDGDADIVTGTADLDHVYSIENLGNGNFGQAQLLAHGAWIVTSVDASDLDGDGDQDVLATGYGSDGVYWCENSGDGTFGPLQTITTDAVEAACVFATDLDGDGDADVLSASRGDDKIAWYENLSSAGQNYCDALPNSTGEASWISAFGSTSLSAENLELHASNAPANQFAVFFAGPGETSLAFGDGLRCVGGGIVRLTPTVSTAGSEFVQVVDFASHGGAIGAFDPCHFQCWYRDPAAAGSGFNLSDGLRIFWTP